MAYLLDTNIISELCAVRPHPAVMRWFEAASATKQTLAVSVVSLEEIAFGMAWKPRPAKQVLIDSLLADLRTYPISAEIARLAGQLRGLLQTQGMTRSTPDMLIAATAQIHKLSVVTRNEKDFAGCGVAVVNPFSFIQAKRSNPHRV